MLCVKVKGDFVDARRVQTVVHACFRGINSDSIFPFPFSIPFGNSELASGLFRAPITLGSNEEKRLEALLRKPVIDLGMHSPVSFRRNTGICARSAHSFTTFSIHTTQIERPCKPKVVVNLSDCLAQRPVSSSVTTSPSMHSVGNAGCNISQPWDHAHYRLARLAQRRIFRTW